MFTEALDFLPLSSECRILDFTHSEGTQTQCSYIEILDDDEIEFDEQFLISLSTINPQVTISNGAATVTIVDDDGSQPQIATPTSAPTSTPSSGGVNVHEGIPIASTSEIPPTAGGKSYRSQ